MRELDGAPYGQLRRVQGRWPQAGFEVRVLHVQGDVHGPPSRLEIRLLPTDYPLLSEALNGDDAGRLVLEDLLLREAASHLENESLPAGDGSGGRLGIARPGPDLRPRAASRLLTTGWALRFTYHFPATGRRVLADPAREMLGRRLPAFCLDLLRKVPRDRWVGEAADLRAVRAARDALPSLGLVAFLPQGAVMPRDREGRPLPDGVPLAVPPELRVQIPLPNGTRVEGWGVRPGVTVLAGSAFHGKTTVLEALEAGAGDLRPCSTALPPVSLRETVWARVEDRRTVRRCDISPFFRELPKDIHPRTFSTEAASGSTSQAASILEALATGTKLLLIDEDASAANFLGRDPAFEALLGPAGDVVTPLVRRLPELRARGISVVLVAGSSAEWLAVADQVVVLRDFAPHDATERARSVAPKAPLRHLPPALWEEALTDQPMPSTLEFREALPQRLRVSAGKVRWSEAAEADLSTSGIPDERLRGACQALRAYIESARSPTRDGWIAWMRSQEDQSMPHWDDPRIDEAAWPAQFEIWTLWQRFRMKSGADR